MFRLNLIVGFDPSIVICEWVWGGKHHLVYEISCCDRVGVKLWSRLLLI
jgi:hypothetical protein